MLVPQNRSWLTALLLVPLAALFLTTAAHADDDDGDRRSMTGVWVTTSPAWWIVRYELGVLAGDVQMRWELDEDENGLISGFNIWHAPNPEEGSLGIGAMCMVGARNGSRVVISESGIFNQETVGGPLVPSFEFECRRGWGAKARCVGNGFSSQPPVALTGNMKRLKHPGPETELAGFALAQIREFCATGNL